MRTSRILVIGQLAVIPLSGLSGCGSESPAPPTVGVPADTTHDDGALCGVEDQVIGMPEAKTTAAIEGAGLTARVVERDVEGLPATTDFRRDRINLVIADGRVIRTSRG